MDKWQMAYAAILIIAVPAIVFHAVQDRWAQAIVGSIAVVIGVIILVSELREASETEGQTG